MIRTAASESNLLSPEDRHSFYRRHVQAAFVQGGASVVMWGFALVAYMTDLIQGHHFLGVSITVLYLVLINPPILRMMKGASDTRHLFAFSTAINFLEILGYTAVIYFLGGVEAAYLTCIYAAMIAYIGTVSTRQRTFLITGMCITAYSAMVLLEGAGLLPWLKVLPDFHLTWPHRLARMLVVDGLLVVVAYITSHAATILRKTRDQLRAAQHQLEQRVAERTDELSESNAALRKEIQERQAAEAKLHRAEKMEALGTLAGGVAHDLNNILSGIVSYPELLLMDMPADSPMRRPVAMIKKSGDKAAAIVQDLLHLAQPVVVTKEIVNLNTIVHEYAESPEYEALQRHHPLCSLTATPQANLMNIAGSAAQLSKCVMNLVSNAFEAMPEGGQATISTSNCIIDAKRANLEQVSEGEYVVLAVTDTGLGISSEDQDRIFEPFFSKKRLGRSGSGLGMAVVWGVVKDHRGYVDVQSELDKGTTFRLYFPVTHHPSLALPTTTDWDRLRGQGQTILVVDDIEEQRLIACEVLNRLGYEAAAVSSGEAAVAYLKKYTVDLLIIDMLMEPGMNGLETFLAIRKIRPQQKALIASGYAETKDVQTALQMGASAYVHKPYSIEQIGLSIQDAL